MRSDNQQRQRELLSFLSNQVGRIQAAIESKIPGFLDKIEEVEKQRSSFISGYRRIPLGCQSFFMVLRKWNSYTPSLPAASTGAGIKEGMSQYSIGGGYFLYIQAGEDAIEKGYGLVIDPGYNFIHNFGFAGFCLDDIDGILITHAHNDHTNDFESILSLLYQRNNKFLGRKTPKKIDLFLNVGAFKKFSNYLDLSNNDNNNYFGNVIVMSPGQVYEIPEHNLDCQILTLYTNHNEIITSNYGLGICFKIAGRNVFLTGDTGWTQTLAFKNADFLKKHEVFTREERESESNNIDVLVAHLGSIKRKEFEINPDAPEAEKCYYSSHLGILGVISMIELWKPDLCVISEFGEELNELRETLTREIEKTCTHLRESISIIPGDVGFCILLDERTGLCYFEKKFVPWSDLCFKDVVDPNFKQKVIKYFDKKYKDGDEHALAAIPTINSINNIRTNCLEQIKEYFNLDNLSLAELLSAMANEAYDWEDPHDVSDSIFRFKGMLLALSCIIEDPIHVIKTATCCHLDLIKEYLDTYYFDSRLFDKYCYKRVSEDAFRDPHSEHDLRYKASMQYIEKFIESYTQNDESAATASLEMIGTTSVQDYWENINDNEKIELLIEYKGIVDIIEMNDVFSMLKKYITSYFEFLDIENKIPELNQKIAAYLGQQNVPDHVENEYEINLFKNMYELLKMKYILKKSEVDVFLKEFGELVFSR